MGQTDARRRNLKVRVINFSDLPIVGHEAVTFTQLPTPELTAALRTYADLPCVYVIPADRASFLPDVLGCLKAARTPSYPHAVFALGGSVALPGHPDVDVVSHAPQKPSALSDAIERYALSKLDFDTSLLRLRNDASLPDAVDVVIVGAGITGLYAASVLKEKGLSVCVLEKTDVVGGIWATYANVTSKVNSSEPAYRVREPSARANRDHSDTAEVLEDLRCVARQLSGSLFPLAAVQRIAKQGTGYTTTVERGGKTSGVASTGVICAVNDRIGAPRVITWKNEKSFRGAVVNGLSNEALNVDWRDKRVVVVGMGAFAVENVRTALEAGARHVTVVCRRHGTVCPKIVDYLNFATPYDEKLQHERKASVRTMSLWKKVYDLSGATQPECWMAKMKHDGHTISVSDIWFIAHYLKRMSTVTGSVEDVDDSGVVVGGRRIEADVVVKCVGFHRNASAAAALCGATETYNNNYIDRDFMYLADAFIDDNAHTSFFGSSVLEMVKFYVEVYAEFFDNPGFQQMLHAEGIRKIPITDRKWSDYIAGANALMRAYPRVRDFALAQIERRTADFLQTYDLDTYIAANRREWFDTHRMLAAHDMPEADCLPFVFEKLLDKKA
jgi:cation diffusion facilitator CzcD-associated flavoprotein CzcO